MTLSATPYRLGLFGDIHHAATALTDPLEQLVSAQGLAHRFVGWLLWQVELDGRLRSGGGIGGERILWCLMRGEQSFQSCAQRSIVAALAIEKLRSLVRRFRQGQLEQKFFAVPVHGLGLFAATSEVSTASNPSSANARATCSVSQIAMSPSAREIAKRRPVASHASHQIAPKSSGKA